MAREIHRAVEHADDLECLSLDSEQDDVLSLRCDLATGKQVVPKSPVAWFIQNILELTPEIVEVNLLLFPTPSLERLLPDRLQVANRSLGELEVHESPRARFINAFFDCTPTVSPAFNWAKPSATSRLSHSLSTSCLSEFIKAARSPRSRCCTSRTSFFSEPLFPAQASTKYA